MTPPLGDSPVNVSHVYLALCRIDMCGIPPDRGEVHFYPKGIFSLYMSSHHSAHASDELTHLLPVLFISGLECALLPVGSMLSALPIVLLLTVNWSN